MDNTAARYSFATLLQNACNMRQIISVFSALQRVATRIEQFRTTLTFPFFFGSA
jgi:hypothetical protein